MKRCFIAGPYTANADDLILCNVLTACKAAAKLVEAGLCPFVPHLSHYIDRCCESYVDYEAWMKQTLQWVDVCDCVLRLPGASPGADREVVRANDLGIPVFYTIQEVVEHFKERGCSAEKEQTEVARDEAEDHRPTRESKCVTTFRDLSGRVVTVTTTGTGTITVNGIQS